MTGLATGLLTGSAGDGPGDRLLTVAPAAAAASGAATSSGPLVVIGVGGVRWADVTATGTPAMWSLLEQGSTATVTVRSVYAATCPVDGWLTVNAGQRAADLKPAGSRNPPPCRAGPPAHRHRRRRRHRNGARTGHRARLVGLRVGRGRLRLRPPARAC